VLVGLFFQRASSARLSWSFSARLLWKFDRHITEDLGDAPQTIVWTGVHHLQRQLFVLGLGAQALLPETILTRSVPQIASVQSWRNAIPFRIAAMRIVVPSSTSIVRPAGRKVIFGILAPHAARALIFSIASSIIQSGVSLAPMMPTLALPPNHSGLSSSTFSIL